MGRVVEWLSNCRDSRKLILVIVFIALLLDNMLLTTIVPIIPVYLYEIQHPPSKATIQAAHPTEKTYAPTPTLPPTSVFSQISTAYALDNEEDSGHLPVATEFLKNITGPDPPPSPTPTVKLTGSEILEMNHEDLVNENVDIGLLVCSKAFVQLISNPFVGPLTHRIGYSIPMFTGFVILFISTLIFAFGSSYLVLFIARSIQGIGSSCSSVSGMGMLAERYPDNKERGRAMGTALSGLALGVLIGPPFGSVMFQFVGKSAPFLALAGLALGDGLLQLLVLQPSVVKREREAPTLSKLFTDPYIIIAAGAITFANLGMGMLIPSLPLWMMYAMGAPEWQLGAAFVPSSFSFIISTNIFGRLGHLIGRWLVALIGLGTICICLMSIPSATCFSHLIAPMAGMGLSIGMVNSSMMPQLGYLVDLRHSAVYGSVYSIGDLAFCLGFAISTSISGFLVEEYGFERTLYGVAITTLMYTPLMYFLRAPPAKNPGEQQGLMYEEKSTVGYFSYQNDDEEN